MHENFLIAQVGEEIERGNGDRFVILSVHVMQSLGDRAARPSLRHRCADRLGDVRKTRGYRPKNGVR